MKFCGEPLRELLTLLSLIGLIASSSNVNRVPEDHSECWNDTVISDVRKDIHERMRTCFSVLLNNTTLIQRLRTSSWSVLQL